MLPDTHLAGALQFPEVWLQGQNIRVSGPAVQYNQWLLRPPLGPNWTIYLGVVLDSRKATIVLIPERQQVFKACLCHFQPHFWLDYWFCLLIMGLMAANLDLGLCPQGSNQTKVVVSQSPWWRNSANIVKEDRTSGLLLSCVCVLGLFRLWMWLVIIYIHHSFSVLL